MDQYFVCVERCTRIIQYIASGSRKMLKHEILLASVDSTSPPKPDMPPFRTPRWDHITSCVHCFRSVAVRSESCRAVASRGRNRKVGARAAETCTQRPAMCTHPAVTIRVASTPSAATVHLQITRSPSTATSTAPIHLVHGSTRGPASKAAFIIRLRGNRAEPRRCPFRYSATNRRKTLNWTYFRGLSISQAVND